MMLRSDFDRTKQAVISILAMGMVGTGAPDRCFGNNSEIRAAKSTMIDGPQGLLQAEKLYASAKEQEGWRDAVDYMDKRDTEKENGK
jgi:hypothetical protein